MTTRENEFDDHERELWEAYDRYLADLGPHGQLLSEALDPGANPNDYNTKFGFKATPPRIDWALKAQQDALDNLRKSSGPDANLNGVVIGVEKYQW
ncbi:hypothetical protein [Mycetocola saprophilus]|uniref:hypothetical protein n=1 Tax=Mycetocola saprophilus TaxID=76636 RepID=UPI003BEF8694